VKPAAFEYYAPATVDECVELLSEHEGEEPKLLAGGQSLVPMMNLRMARPEIVIDLNGIKDLAYIQERGGELVIGAMTRYSEIEASPLVRGVCRVLSSAIAEVGYPAVRNRGTIGGSVAHADPVAEVPCVMRTLDAEMVAVGPAGERAIPASDFFTGVFSTALQPNEVLTEVRLPIRRGTIASSFVEFARKKGDYAVVAVAVELAVHGGEISEARVGLANLADRPVRSAAVEHEVVGQPIPAGAEDAAWLGAVSDVLRSEHSGDPYRVNLAGVLTGRALRDALEQLVANVI